MIFLKNVREVHISPYCRLALVPPNVMKFGIRGQLTEVITYVKFLVNRFRGYRVLTPPKLPSHWLAASPLQQCTLGLPTVTEWPGSSRNWPTVSRVPGEAHFVPEMWKLTTGHGYMAVHYKWEMSVLYFVLFVTCQSHTTWLDLSVMSLTNEIVIIRLAANTIYNDEMQQA